MIIGTSFPEDGWDPLLKAAVVATDFAVAAAAKAIAHPSEAKLIDGWEVMREELEKHLTLTPESIRAELAHLLDLRLTERGPGYQGAIHAQAGDFTAYYADLLACSPATRPATWSLVLIGLQVGGMIAARFKGEFMRARPVQVWPGVAPMIETPAHPAYPSGHALQAYLIEACVARAAPAMGYALRGLSEEVAVNRERAGVHWPSDKEGSWAIVPTIMAVLEKVPSFEVVLGKAKLEWGAGSNKEGRPPPTGTGAGVSVNADIVDATKPQGVAAFAKDNVTGGTRPLDPNISGIVKAETQPSKRARVEVTRTSAPISTKGATRAKRP